MERYSKRQVRLLVTLFLAYTAAYISRTNLSPALDAIQSDFGLTAAQAQPVDKAVQVVAKEH